MGVYYRFDPITCMVHAGPANPAGYTWQWCGAPTSGYYNMNVNTWNSTFIYCKIPVPANCVGTGTGTAPGTGPGTGPGEDPPPPEGCDPGTPIDVTPIDDGPITQGSHGGGGGRGSFFRVGVGPEVTQGSGPIDVMAQPLTAGLTPLPLYTSDVHATALPTYTQKPYLEVKKRRGIDNVDIYHEGTGSGFLIIHPPELQDYHLHGSSVNVGSRWPTNISETSLLLHNSVRSDGSTGSSSVTYLAFGLPNRILIRPQSGAYFTLNPVGGAVSAVNLNLKFTDANAANTNFGHFRLDGCADLGQFTTLNLPSLQPRAGSLVWNTTESEIQFYTGAAWSPITAAGVSFPLNGPDNGDAAYMFDNATIPGSINAGMKFDTVTDQGPSFHDIAGTSICRVTSAGFEITGKLTVSGLIDPTGLEFDPVAANPGGVAANTLWLDSLTSNKLKHGANFVVIDPGTTGLFVITASGSYATRTIVGTAPITVANGDGIAANPTLSVSQFTSVASGIVPASGGGTTNFLRADATWAVPTAEIDICSLDEQVGIVVPETSGDEYILIDDCGTNGSRRTSLRGAAAGGVMGGRLVPEDTITGNTLQTYLDDDTQRYLTLLPYTSNEITLRVDEANRVCEITTSGWSPYLDATTLTVNRVYDVYAYWDEVDQRVELEAVIWTSDTVRATAINSSRSLGIVKSGDNTRRLVGTVRIQDSTGNKFISSSSERLIANLYNQRPMKLLRKETTASWTYNNATIRQANGASANRVQVVQCYNTNYVELQVNCYAEASSTSSVILSIGIGKDTTTAFTGDIFGNVYHDGSGAGDAGGVAVTGTYRDTQSIGFHSYNWNEQGNAGASMTIYGFVASAPTIQSGISGSFWG